MHPQDPEQLRGELLAYQALAIEALKLLTPDQRNQVFRNAAPGLNRLSGAAAQGAASKTYADLRRRYP